MPRGAMNGTEEHPLYRKVLEDNGYATKTYLVNCDEGWRESIVCTGMYEYVADWLIEQIQGKPFAKLEKSAALSGAAEQEKS
jgi:hypothetical protein